MDLQTLKKTKFVSSSDINGVKSDYQIWDIDRLFRAATSGQKREIIEIDLKQLCGTSIPCLSMPQATDIYQSYLLIIPGSILVKLYDTYGQRLLERNVRSFLQARGKVNSGIRNTILKEPEMFLAYNNGISATAQDIHLVTLDDGSRAISWLKDLQIVNGAQTTASLYHSVRKDKAEISKISVQAKLTVISQQNKTDEIVPLISEYANSQNKIQTADFSANDPFHRAMQELSRTIWAPSAQGTQKQTHWYYERARGQYTDDKEQAGTPARKRDFEILNPPSQKFTKTDLAKYENTWNMLPHIVSKGAQMSFREFTIHLKENHKNFIPNDTYFKHLVAKAILFKTVDKLVDQLHYGGYKANIVTYTIARLVYESGQRINLDTIWDAQDLSNALKNAAVIFSKHAHQHITDTPADNANVTQWCKKEKCCPSSY